MLTFWLVDTTGWKVMELVESFFLNFSWLVFLLLFEAIESA